MNEVIREIWRQIKIFRRTEGNLKNYSIYLTPTIKAELFPGIDKFGGLPIKIHDGILERQDKTGTKYSDIIICDIKNLSPGFRNALFGVE